MTELKETGGARIGMASATWIFATLVYPKKLELKCNYNWQFGIQANDIVSLVPQSGFLSQRTQNSSSGADIQGRRYILDIQQSDGITKKY
jgi:hypothetical protein